MASDLQLYQQTSIECFTFLNSRSDIRLDGLTKGHDDLSHENKLNTKSVIPLHISNDALPKWSRKRAVYGERG
jgi:hypothetical protein